MVGELTKASPDSGDHFSSSRGGNALIVKKISFTLFVVGNLWRFNGLENLCAIHWGVNGQCMLISYCLHGARLAQSKNVQCKFLLTKSIHNQEKRM